MIANYGYEDGSGAYFVTIDTGACADCDRYSCVDSCPESLFLIELDDYDDEVAAIDPGARRLLKERCAGCKPAGGYASLPCVSSCPAGAITHSW